MVLCNVECIKKISSYLDVSPLQLEMQENVVVSTERESNKKIEGFSTIIQFLIKNSKNPYILGINNEIKALSRQWLEYAVVCVNYADTPVNAKRVLQELNVALSENTYLTGTTKTIADITMYYALHSIMRELTHQEKAQYIHVSRWYDNMQQEEKLRQQLDLISKWTVEHASKDYRKLINSQTRYKLLILYHIFEIPPLERMSGLLAPSMIKCDEHTAFYPCSYIDVGKLGSDCISVLLIVNVSRLYKISYILEISET